MKKGLMTRHRMQLNPYGCGFYALANLFDSNHFEALGNEVWLCSNGNDSYQLNYFLKEYGIQILAIYQNYVLDLEGTFGKVKFDGDYFPFLLSFQITKSKAHMVSGIMHSDGSCDIHDSLAVTSKSYSSLDDFINLSQVNAIFAFYNIDEKRLKLSNKELTLTYEESPDVLLERYKK